jgi:hypothetical protein
MNSLKRVTRKSGAVRKARAWLVVPITALIFLGCEDRQTPQSPNPTPTATPIAGAANPSRDVSSTPTLSASLRDTAREAGEDLRDLGNRVEAKIESTDFEAKKEAFLRNSREELDQLKASIDKLGEKSAVAGGNAKANFQEWLDDLRAKSRDADTELERARASGSDAWDETQTRAQTATQRLKEAYNQTLERMKINE